MMYEREAINYFTTLMHQCFPQRSNTIYQYWNKLWKMLIRYHLGEKSKYFENNIPDSVKQNIFISFPSGSLKIHNLEDRQLLLDPNITVDLKNLLTLINNPIVVNVIHKDTIDKADLQTPEQLQFLLQEIWTGIVYRPIWCICDAIRQLKGNTQFTGRLNDLLRISCELNIKFYFLMATRVINNYNKKHGYTSAIVSYELVKKESTETDNNTLEYTLVLKNNSDIYITKTVPVILSFSDNEYFKDSSKQIINQLHQLFEKLFDIISTKESRIPEDNIDQIGELLIKDIDNICLSSEELEAKLKTINESKAKIIRTPEQEEQRTENIKQRKTIDEYVTACKLKLIGIGAIANDNDKHNIPQSIDTFKDAILDILYTDIDAMPDEYEFIVYTIKRLKIYKSNILYIRGYNKINGDCYLNCKCEFIDSAKESYATVHFIGSKYTITENAPITVYESMNKSSASYVFTTLLKSLSSEADLGRFNKFRSTHLDRFKKCKDKRSSARSIVLSVESCNNKHILLADVFIGNAPFDDRLVNYCD